MSDAHTEHDAPHEGPIKTPGQLVAAVFFAFVVPVIVIVMLATYVSTDTRQAAGSNLMAPEAIAERIQPVGRVAVKDASDGVLKTGEQVFAAQCSACHTAGLVGAPKFGDAAAWAPRIKTGYAALLNSALKGKNAMPAQGGGELSEYRDRPGRRLHGQQGRRQVRRAEGPRASASAAVARPRRRPSSSSSAVGARAGSAQCRVAGLRQNAKRATSCVKRASCGRHAPLSTASEACSMSCVWTSPRPRSVARKSRPLLVEPARFDLRRGAGVGVHPRRAVHHLHAPDPGRGLEFDVDTLRPVLEEPAAVLVGGVVALDELAQLRRDRCGCP